MRAPFTRKDRESACTPADKRQRAGFHTELRSRDPITAHVSVAERPLAFLEAVERLTGELGRLGAREATISTNVSLRRDGFIRTRRGTTAGR